MFYHLSNCYVLVDSQPIEDVIDRLASWSLKFDDQPSVQEVTITAQILYLSARPRNNPKFGMADIPELQDSLDTCTVPDQTGPDDSGLWCPTQQSELLSSPGSPRSALDNHPPTSLADLFMDQLTEERKSHVNEPMVAHVAKLAAGYGDMYTPEGLNALKAANPDTDLTIL
jgi:hypothetical protein